MSSNHTIQSKILKIFLLPIISVSLLSCNLPINEKVPEPVSPDTKLGSSAQCLDNVLVVMEEYLDGTAEPQAVAATWDCFGSAISLFQKSTRGRYQDRFQAREIANFFETYFLKPGSQISDDLLIEIFRLKQLFVGGSDEFITRKEMNNLIKLSEALKGISLRLLPYMKIFSLRWETNGFVTLDNDIRYFEAANLEIQRAAKDFGAIIAQNGRSYRLQNFVTLLEEVSKLYGSNWPWLNDFREALPLVYKLKRALAGGDEEVIAPFEWRRFGLISSRAYIQFLRYFYFLKQKEDEAGSPELIYLTRSVDDLFSFLGDMVREKPEGVFTIEELLALLKSVSELYPQFKISDKLVIESMKIKRLIFGGSLDSWLPSDFDRARSKVEQFRTIAEKFLSYVQIYGLDWRPREIPEEEAEIYYRESEAALVEVGDRLGRLIEEEYDLNDFMSFAAEWDRLYPPKDESGGFSGFVKPYMPLLISAKNVIFSDFDSVVRKSQWRNFLKIGSAGYNRYLYYFYFLQGRDSLLSGHGLTSMGRLVDDLARFIDEIINLKPANPVSTITFTEINSLLDGALKSGLLSDKITLPTLQLLFKAIVQKILIDPEKRLRGTPPGGITSEVTQAIRNEFNIWYSNQIFIADLFGNLPTGSRVFGKEILGKLQQNEPSVGFSELATVLKSPLSMAYDDEGRLFLGNTELGYSLRSLSMVNLSRSISRLVIRSYAMDIERVRSYSGVSVTEVNELFADVKGFAIEAGVLDPRSSTFAENRFRESNLFTTMADGNELMSFKEGADIFLMIFSGVKITGMIFKDLGESCAIDTSPELKDEHSVELNCFVNYYRSKTPGAFASMPDFLLFQEKLDENSYKRVLVNLLKAAGYVPDGGNRIKLGDSSLVPHVVQYIETIFQKYDANRNGYLERDEALRAFPTFRKVLRDVSGLKKESQLRAIFTYLLKYAKAPSTTSEYIKFGVWWLRGEKAWKVKADREKLSLILGFIADAVRGNGKSLNMPPELEQDLEENPDKYKSVEL